MKEASDKGGFCMPVDRTVSLFSAPRVEEEVDVLFVLSGNFGKMRVRTDPPLTTCPLKVQGRLLEFNPDEPDWKRLWGHREDSYVEHFLVVFGGEEYQCNLLSDEGHFEGTLRGAKK